jgi:hypothetical protein
VDSIATVRTRQDCSQSASSYRSRVNVSKDRTGSAARSGGTATNTSSVPTSMPAQQHRQHAGATRAFALLLAVLRHCRLLLLEPAAREYDANKLLNEIAAENGVITDLYVTPNPCFPSGADEHQCRLRAVAAAGSSGTIVACRPFISRLLGAANLGFPLLIPTIHIAAAVC